MIPGNPTGAQGMTQPLLRPESKADGLSDDLAPAASEARTGIGALQPGAPAVFDSGMPAPRRR
ncbi:hypothetical protein [Ramlibacter albus]|uniref:Uncharacterized protein n=1 Tax=Ramlibacter albus TaxID=2079448 RepID=A0A923M9X0_9BURK|nr:hypothetical protein [Ramlibacter albus]MBC5766503.1 hypothetical protein [Ramlibacter albus]